MDLRVRARSTPFAAQVTATDAAKGAVEHGMKTANVCLHGPGAGRESALRALQGSWSDYFND